MKCDDFVVWIEDKHALRKIILSFYRIRLKYRDIPGICKLPYFSVENSINSIS
jgi:hypothetical protein